MSSGQGGTLQIPASLALGAVSPRHTHTHPRPQHSVKTLSWLLWTPSSLHPQGPERDPRIPQPLGTAVLTAGSLDTRTPAPLACILEIASQSPPDTTAGTLGFMLAAPPPTVHPFCAHLCTHPLPVAAMPTKVSSPCLEAVTRPGPDAPRTSRCQVGYNHTFFNEVQGPLPSWSFRAGSPISGLRTGTSCQISGSIEVQNK